ncbi:class I SAM-dependent methyltransferase [Methanosphaerula palustris]|uniref:Methyltransferase type 11 n=1 Tax=Methanosphaerula palustris (strain ATCC BAA-1556 / DSM 19958 / E1-9c) TaxID=521011 RepID=B8GH63_METPE|nr:methyltransferase domain-containing protein [Methanosphaerula palustris]ACL16468.1 Methyltransferase type 11 [Methanosphaerula palustris E1-9c]
MIKSIAHHDTIELAERYDQVSEGQYNNGLTLIANLGVKKGQTVLDIGCGTGRLTSRVAKIVGDTGQVIGIDPSKERIEIARRNVPDSPRSNISLEIGDANSLYHFQNNSFDIVYLNIVFHWIDNKKDALSQIYRVLKPGGLLGITTGNRDQPHTVTIIADRILTQPKYARSAQQGRASSKPVNVLEMVSLLHATGYSILDITTEKDPRYFESPLKCLEDVEASTSGTFLSNVPKNLKRSAHEEIQTELNKHATVRGIENVYNTIFVVAEK